MFAKYAVRVSSVVLVLLFFLTAVSEAKMYRWKDKSGTTHFTDFPPTEEEPATPDEELLPTPSPPKKPAVTAPGHDTKVIPKQDKTAAPITQQLSSPTPAPTPTLTPSPSPTPTPVVTASVPPPSQNKQPSATPVQNIQPQKQPVKKFPVTVGKTKITPKSKYALFKNFEIISIKYPMFMTVAPIVIFLLAMFFGYSLFRIAKLLEIPAVLIALIPVVNFYTVVIVSGKPMWWMALLLFPLTLPYAFTSSYMSLAENLGLDRKAGLVHAVSYVFLGISFVCIVLLPVSFLLTIAESVFLLLGTLAFFLTPEYLIFLSGKKRKQDEMFAERFADGQLPSERKAWDDVSDESTVDVAAVGAGLAASRGFLGKDFSYIDDTVAVYSDDQDEAVTLEQPAPAEDEETLTINKGEALGFEVVEDDSSHVVHRLDSDEDSALRTDDEEYETITGIGNTDVSDDRLDAPSDLTASDDEFKLVDDEGSGDFDLSPELDSDLVLEQPLDETNVENQKPYEDAEVDLSSSLEIDLGDEPQVVKDEQSSYSEDDDFEIKDEDYDYSDDSTVVLGQDIEDFRIDIDDKAQMSVSEKSDSVIEPDFELSLDDEPRLSDSAVIATEESGVPDLDDIADLELSLDDEPRLSDSAVIATEESGVPDLDDIADIELSLDDEPRLSDSAVIATEESGVPDLDDIADLGLTLDDGSDAGPILIDEEETIVPSKLSFENYDLSLNDPTMELISGSEIAPDETLPDVPVLSADLDIAGIDDISTDNTPTQEDSSSRGKKKGGRKPRG
ncbi:DUF4124 domain-containing protein [Candidatus Magnetomonas plexicatena]|uniref:DUF4124 domain-containing protein n=1 Tax=Candidatus Magnetomonas plexicatena TaxID=2552947 RepID=UPI001C741B5A|nr:DUF4124 domain-containing protein [Nitrospirales bacterium LBB_01]